ncbi:hypothetical protein PMAC_000786 [Pneumocystis sp. 'macacae']|nr:hypothetical protein PMAC_000786 [Pneumocystis sp. 'macacae']
MQYISSKNHEKHQENKDKDVQDGSWWEATKIIGERKNEYKVSWAGIDPETGKTYKPCWVRKSDCTEELLNTWIKNHKQRKTKKPTSIGKKRMVDGSDVKKHKKKKESGDFHDKCGSDVSEKKHEDVFKNEHKGSFLQHSSVCMLDTMDVLDSFDSSLSAVDSQNRSYLKPFESLEYTLGFSEIEDSSDISCRKFEELRTFDNTLGTYHTSPIKTRFSSINVDAEINEGALDTEINDISMSRIFNFSESPKKLLNIENDNDHGKFLEDTVSSIYNITNDNNIKSPDFHMEMLSRPDSIFTADNNVSNISVDKQDRIDKNDKEVNVLKESKYEKESSLKSVYYDSVPVNYDSQQLRSPLPSEKVSTWLSHNESLQLGIFDDSHAQISTSAINTREDISCSIEYNCSDTYISTESGCFSEIEKDDVSVKSKTIDSKVSTKSYSNVSTVYTSDSFLASLRSIQNKPHVYFFGIEMNKMQRKLYLQLILQHNDLIQEFSSLSNPDKTLIKKVHRFINILTMLTIHPYLIFKSKISNEAFKKIKLDYLIHFSPKFQFLACFLEKSKNLKLLIGIISDSEILLSLLEIFFQKLNISYLRINHYFENIDINETIRVFLIAHGKGRGKNIEVHCNLIICIYTSIHILSTRNFSDQDNEMKNYIIPITVNSVEHIQLCIKDIPQNLYFQNVIKVTILLRKFAGILPSNQFFSNESAQLIYNWIQGDCKDRWMLPVVSDLRELAITLAHKDSSLIPRILFNNLIELEEKIFQHDNYSYNELCQETQKTPSIATRSDLFDNDDKKDFEDLFDQFELSHLQPNVYNSIVNDHSNYLILNLEVQKPYLNNNEISSDVKTEQELMNIEINNLKKYICKIQDKLKNTENELSSFKIACDRLQTRYEEMQEQYRNLKLEYEDTVNAKDRLQKRLNDLQEDYIRIKEDNNSYFHAQKSKDISFNLEKQEKISTDIIYNSGKEYFEENLHLKKIIENKTSDFEFLRLQYQEASSSAVKLANEVKELECENIRLKNKVESETIRLKEMMIQLLEKNMNKRIEELEAQNLLYLKQLKLKVKNDSIKLSSRESFPVFDTFSDIKTVSRECLGKNLSHQNSEDSNEHLISETIMNVSEF